MARIKDLSSALPGENDAFAFDGANGTKRISYAEFKQKLIDDGFGSGSSEAVVLTQAEYDALPDEIKDSDTIFFISDAPFNLPNVVTCTAAEYAAMSDATKTDGRLYYVTDEAEVAKSLVVQTNQNSTETVPSSAVVYSGLKQINDDLTERLPSGIVYNANNIRIRRAGNLYFASAFNATVSAFRAAYAQFYTRGGGVFRAVSMYDFTTNDFVVVTATTGSSELNIFPVTGWGSSGQVADTDVIQGEMFWGA